MAPDLPENYNTFTLPHLLFSHHPPSSTTVTPVIILKLHRPEARNAFTDETASSLVRAYNLLSSDPRIRCIVFTSSDTSNRFFCPGMDLDPQGHQGSAGPAGSTLEEYRDGGGKVALAMHNCTKPIIAAINGSAVGVGITMTLPASIRIASQDAKVGFVFARRGFNMEACSSFYLPRLVGSSRALHLVTTGSVYKASDPLLSQLFSEVLPPAEVLPRALAIADEVAGNVSNVAAGVMRDMIYRGPGSPEEAHLLESKVFYELIAGRDAKEGVVSFLEKRAPRFEGSMEEDAPSVYPWWSKVDTTTGKPKL